MGTTPTNGVKTSTDGNHRSVLHLRCRGSSRRKMKTESTRQTRRPTQHTEVGTRVVKSMEDPLTSFSSVILVTSRVSVSQTREASRERSWWMYHHHGSFKKVASVTQLKKSAFKKPDKIPYTYALSRLFCV